MAAVFQKIKDIIKHNQENKPDKDTSNGSLLEEKNDITTIDLRKEEPKYVGAKKQYIYYVVFAIVLIGVYAVFTGMQADKEKEKEQERLQAEQYQDSKAVTGDHLINVPKNYQEQAEYEAKKAEEERRKKQQEEEKSASDTTKSSTATDVPQVPPTPSIPNQPAYDNYNNGLSVAEQLRLKKEEEKQKALESPIGFEIKEDK